MKANICCVKYNPGSSFYIAVCSYTIILLIDVALNLFVKFLCKPGNSVRSCFSGFRSLVRAETIMCTTLERPLFASKEMIQDVFLFLYLLVHFPTYLSHAHNEIYFFGFVWCGSWEYYWDLQSTSNTKH